MKLNFALLTSPPDPGGHEGMRGASSISVASSVPQSVPCSGDDGGQTWQPEAGERDCPPLSPSHPKVGGHEKPNISAPSPVSPVVPSINDELAFDVERFEERAAIMEFDGGLSREDAEREAMKSLTTGKATP